MECDRFEWIFKHDLWSGSGSPKRPPRCIETTKSAHWNALSRPEKSRIQNLTVVGPQSKPSKVLPDQILGLAKFSWTVVWFQYGAPKKLPRCIETMKSAHWNVLSCPEKSRIQNHTVLVPFQYGSPIRLLRCIETKGVTHVHQGPIWYHLEPSSVPYCPNQFLDWYFFLQFLTTNPL